MVGQGIHGDLIHEVDDHVLFVIVFRQRLALLIIRLGSVRCVCKEGDRDCRLFGNGTLLVPWLFFVRLQIRLVIELNVFDVEVVKNIVLRFLRILLHHHHLIGCFGLGTAAAQFFVLFLWR